MSGDKLYHVTMSKVGNPAIAYLKKWEEGTKGDLGFLGTGVAFSSSNQQAISFSAAEAVRIIQLLRENQTNTSIRYSTADKV